MRLFSFSLINIAKAMKSTLLRFPLPLFIAVLFTIVGIGMNHHSDNELFSKLVLSSVVFFPISIAGSLAAEKFQIRLWTKIIGFLLFSALFIAYYFSLPASFKDLPYIVMIHSIMFFCMGLLSMTIFSRNKIQTLYWEHVVSLLFDAIITVFCAISIYIAVLIALWSMDLLFQIHWPNTLWGDIWFVVAGFFSPYFFLAHIAPLHQEEQEPAKVAFPLQWFITYIGFPASVIYFAILYAYSAKILITGAWPNGQVATLVIWFSVIALLCFVILYKKVLHLNRSVLLQRLFFCILLPQMGMLFWTTWLRIESVGVTESRYALIAGGIWISLLAVYFLFSRKRLLPVFSYSLLAIILISSFGPWSIGEVSKSSQMHELQELLQKNNAWKDGKVVQTETTITPQDGGRIMNIVNYMSRTHTLSPLKAWFDTGNTELTEQYIADLLKVPLYGGYMDPTSCYLSTDGNNRNFSITGYDGYFNSIGLSTRYVDLNESVMIDGVKYTLTTKKNPMTVSVESNGQSLMDIPLDTITKNFMNTYCAPTQGGKTLSSTEMSYVSENDKIRIQFLFESISGEKNESTEKASYTTDNLTAKALLDIK